MAENMRKRKRTPQDGDSSPLQDDEVSPATAPDIPETGASEPEQKRQQQRRSLFVRGLSADTTTDALIAHFSTEFPIKHGHAVIDAATKKCKGYGFIAFADAEDAKRAIEELDGSELLGRKVRLEIAEPRKREIDDTLPGDLQPKTKMNKTALDLKEKRKAKVYQTGDIQAEGTKLIVRNLPWSIKEPDQLAKHFLSYGKIRFATLPKKGPKTLAGFGFVMMRGHKNAEKALNGVNGKEVDGRKLAVDWAVDKKTWDRIAEKTELEDDDDENQASDEEDDVAEVGNAIDSELSSMEEAEEEDNDEEEENGDNTDTSSIDEDAADDAEEDGITDEKTQAANDSEDKSSTLFIRNIPFTTTDDDLFQHFRRLAPVRYARVVVDSTTERPRGTAFVCFREAADATRILKDAPRSTVPQSQQSSGQKSHSILQDDAADSTGAFTLDGRILALAPAVTKSTASSLAEASSTRRANDKRRLYLLSEGTIAPSSALYASLPKTEVAMRDASLAQRKTLLQKNPSLHLSLTRLSIRNIPRSIDTKALKSLAREAIVGFAADAKEGKRERLSREELSRAADEMSAAETARKHGGKGVVKQAKIVYEAASGSKVSGSGGDSGGGRSRGYGFVEYHTHRAALMGLRWLNGRAMEGQGGEARKRLIVEFAIENAQVVQRRGERVERARAKPNATAVNPKRGFGGAARKGDPPNPKSKEAPKPSGSREDLDKIARRQRIINKKRAARRGNKRAGKS